MLMGRAVHLVNLGITFIILTAIHPSTWAGDCSHDAGVFRCVKYLGNYDGDTLTVNIPRVHQFFGKKVPIRINGIDTPERKSDHPCEKEKALEAQKVTNQFLANAEEIELRNAKRGKYFRIVADVYADGRSLADELLYRGLAVPYDGEEKPYVNWCR